MEGAEDPPGPPSARLTGYNSGQVPAIDTDNTRPIAPPFPGGIGGLKVGLAGIGGLGGIGGLKKSLVSDVSFIQRDFTSGAASSAWKISIDERMRYIDSFKLYKPIKEECDELNIPDDRIDLAQLNGLMILSFGNVGARYSTEEMNLLVQQTVKLNEIYTEITTWYQGVSAAVRKKKLTTDSLNRQEFSEEETCLVNFHKLCDKYYDVLAEYRLFASSKKLSKGDNARAPDPEALSSKPLPVWLTIVLLKYQTSFNIPSDKKPSVLSIPRTLLSLAYSPITKVGKLSAFISCCLFNQFDCTTEEKSAIDELVEASNDQAAACNHSSQRYWSKRIFTFLNKITELKSYVKDEKSLYNFSPDSFRV